MVKGADGDSDRVFDISGPTPPLLQLDKDVFLARSQRCEHHQVFCAPLYIHVTDKGKREPAPVKTGAGQDAFLLKDLEHWSEGL